MGGEGEGEGEMNGGEREGWWRDDVASGGGEVMWPAVVVRGNADAETG